MWVQTGGNMTEKLTRRQIMRRGFWLTVGAAFVPAWARKLTEDMERAEPKPRVFMPSMDYSQLELRMMAYAQLDAETTRDYSLRGLAKSHNFGLFDHKTTPRRYSESGRLLYDSGVRYRVSSILQDEIVLDEHPEGETIREIFDRFDRAAAMQDMLNYMYFSGIKVDRAYIDQLMGRLDRRG
jgi:hypothetical protein